MKNNLSYKGYYGSVEYSGEDNIFHGKIIGINDHITYEGDSVHTLQKDFITAIEEYIKTCTELGKEPEKTYKGSFNVRIEPALHRQLVVYSISNRKSLNSAVEEAIRSYLQ